MAGIPCHTTDRMLLCEDRFKRYHMVLATVSVPDRQPLQLYKFPTSTCVTSEGVQRCLRRTCEGKRQLGRAGQLQPVRGADEQAGTVAETAGHRYCPRTNARISIQTTRKTSDLVALDISPHRPHHGRLYSKTSRRYSRGPHRRQTRHRAADGLR